MTTIEILLSELLLQSLQLKNSTEPLESWHQKDLLSSITKRELSPTKPETRSILNSRPLKEKLPMPGAILTSPPDSSEPKKEKSMVPSKMLDTTHSQPPLMMLMVTPQTVTTPSTFNPLMQSVHIVLFSL